MTCSRNLFKHLKICYQTKTNREISQHDFQSFANLTIVFSPQKNDQIFPFHIYFSHLCKISNQKKKNLSWHVYFNVFNHIVTFRENDMKFCIWWVGKSSFNFSFLGLVLGPGCTLEETAKKQTIYSFINIFIALFITTKWSSERNPVKLLLLHVQSTFGIWAGAEFTVPFHTN